MLPGENKVCTITNDDIAPVLTLVKTVDPELTNPGKSVVYTVVVENTGESTAYNVVLSDELPIGFTFADDGERIRTWELGDMKPGDKITKEYEVNVDSNQAAGTYDNIAEVDADNHEKLSDIAPIEVRIPIVLGEESKSELAIEKSVDVEWTNPGKTVNYTVVVSNIGDAPALGVTLTDTLPDGFTFVDTGTNINTWSIGDLVPTESKEIVYEVKIDESVKAGTYENLAVAKAENADPVSDKVPLEIREIVVLGEVDTGAGIRDYLFFGLGSLFLAAGLFLYRRASKQILPNIQ